MSWHRHVWKIRAVQVGTFVVFGGEGTQILKVCAKCPKTKVDVINGSWTAAELTS